MQGGEIEVFSRQHLRIPRAKCRAVMMMLMMMMTVVIMMMIDDDDGDEGDDNNSNIYWSAILCQALLLSFVLAHIVFLIRDCTL